MNNYYFTGVFEPDFNVSGIVEADSESDARRKVRELGYLVNQVQLLCDEPVRQEDCDVETDDMSGSAFPAEAWKRRSITLAISIWGALSRERHLWRRAAS